MQTQQLAAFSAQGDLDLIKANLNDYEYSYGNTYSIDDIRNAIIDKQPSFIRLKKANTNSILFAVGESQDSLYFSYKNKIISIKDSVLEKSWTGDAVIVQSQLENHQGINVGECETASDFFILTPECDVWPDEYFDQKYNTIQKLKKLQLGQSYLPAFPMVATFIFNESKEVKPILASKYEMKIYNCKDTITEAIKKIGYAFWISSLTDTERQQFTDYIESQSELPAIYTSTNYNIIEAFADLYANFIKSKILNPSYYNLIHSIDPQGLSILESVIDRIRNEKKELETWCSQEPVLACFLNSIKKYRLDGNIFRGYLISDKPQIDITIPISQVCSEEQPFNKSLKIITFKDGLLKNQSVVTNLNNNVDYTNTEKLIKGEIQISEKVDTIKDQGEQFSVPVSIGGGTPKSKKSWKSKFLAAIKNLQVRKNNGYIESI